MEAERRSSLRSKRKPLFDCTNTLQNRPTTATLKSKTLIKPPKKPSNNDIFNNKLNPSFCSPPKSHTSTGSNNSPNSFTHVPSISRLLDSSAPSSLISDDGVADCRKSKVTADQIQRQETTRKDKGKMVVETPIIQLSASLTSKTLQVSSSTSPGHSSHSRTQAAQNQNAHMQKYKGKITEDAPVIELPAPFTLKYLQVSSSSGCSFSETSPVHSQKLLEERRMVKGKMVLETPDIEASEPSTPCAPVASFAASGIHDRPLTNYSQRKCQRGRKQAADKINMLLSCPPDQRSKKTGLEVNSDQGVKKSGSHTDPLLVPKEKRSCDKYSMHVMPKEEVEKLKTYYADLDAFELPVEEVASEKELE